MLSGLDLFSGIGGISLALRPWVRTVAYCECELYAQAVLLERMQTDDLDLAPIWDDVRTLSSKILDTNIDIIFGGFPCQDISVAGNGDGLAGKRSGLFFEVLRLAKELQPSFIFLENVPAITSRGLDAVIREIASLGYDTRYGVLSAYDMGAPHLRERWFLLAHSDGAKLRKQQGRGGWQDGQGKVQLGHNGEEKPMADPDSLRKLQSCGCESEFRGRTCHSCSQGGSGQWSVEPDVGRVVNGLPYRMDRVKCLGNAVVPQTAREAFERLMGLKK